MSERNETVARMLAADAMRISEADGEVLLGVYLRKLRYTKYDLDTNNIGSNQFLYK